MGLKNRTKPNIWRPLRSAPQRNLRALRKVRRNHHRGRALLVLAVPVFERDILLQPSQTSKILRLRVPRFPRSFIPQRRLPRPSSSSRYILKDCRTRLQVRMDYRTTGSHRANPQNHRDIDSATKWIRAIYDRRIDHGTTNRRQNRCWR